jgi:hypothetical protein
MAAGQTDELGYTGGYLLSSANGRPLEFHYTTPVRPTATHRILYGAELEKYIYGELIAANLTRQTTLEPSFVVTDQPLILGERARSSCPLVCVASARRSDVAAPEGAADGHRKPDLVAAAGFDADIDALNQWLAETNPSLDLAEPFIRIWQAIRELLRDGTKLAA